MYHLGLMVKNWRTLLQNSVAELEWRMGLLNSPAFEPGLIPTDFQALAKKFMNMYQQTNNQPNSSSSNNSTLGRIVKVQEWHLEDLQYEGGIRSRQSKLVSTLPAKSNSAPGEEGVPGSTVSECVQKQRIMWSDMRVLQRKYDGRFSLKYERPVKASSVANIMLEQRRMQTRRSFWIENYLRVDLSIVQQQQLLQKNNNTNHFSTTSAPVISYEVELELLAEGAQTLSDQQLVTHLYNWIIEIQDSFGKINGSDTVDGPLLVLKLVPNSSNQHSTNTSPNSSTTQKAICADILLVPISRDICQTNR